MKLITMTEKEYMRIHDYVRRKKPYNKTCEHCGLEKKLDNALVTGKSHEKNIDNYIQLCRICHNKYDYPNGKKHSKESIIKIGIASSKRISERGVNPNFINSKKGIKPTQETKDKIANSLKKQIVHGSLTGYHHYKCRCELCKSFYSNYQKKYRKNV